MMATNDKESSAVATFMANLMQTGPSTGHGTNNDTDFHSEVQTYDNHFFDNMNHQVSQEMHQGEQLDSDVDRYKTQVQNLEQSKVKKDLEQLVFERNKRNAELEEQLVSLKQQLLQHVESHKSLKIECEKLKNDKNALEESYLEELVCLRNTNKVVTELLQSYGQPVQTIPMLSKRPTFPTKDLHQTALGHNQLQGKDELIRKLKAQISNMKEVSADPNLSTLEFQGLKTKNTQLKEELTAVTIKNDSLRDENMSIKKRNQDLYKSKVESNNNVSSGAAVPEKPKVLTLGLYVMTPKNDVNVKQVWKDTGKVFASVGSKWRPTGRKFTLGDMCPLTKITKPEVVPLEKSRSVSTSEPANNVTVTPRFFEKPLNIYKRKDRKIKDTSTGSPPNAETQAVNDPVNVNDLSV
nr:hypothetical protein [Tanacetum cinerariifolium]